MSGKEVKIRFEEDEYGFSWGSVQVERFFSDKKRGSVVIGFSSPKVKLQIYATKTGKIRVFSDKKEWLPKEDQ